MGYSLYILGASVIIPVVIIQLTLYCTFGWELLHFAATIGIVDMLPLQQSHWMAIFGMLGGINHRDNLGRTPLHIASQNCYYNSIHALLQAGAAINVVDHKKYTPLHMAVMARHWSSNPSLQPNSSLQSSTIFTRQLLEYTTKHPGESRRHAHHCKLSISMLLEQGSILTLRDSNNLTAFAHTIIRGNSDQTQLFLDNKILQPNSDLLNNSPVFIAARYGRHTTVKLLLAHKRRIASSPSPGSSNIFSTATPTQSAYTTLRWGVNQVDSMGFTALHIAAGNGHVDTVVALLQLGADQSLAENALKYTPLHVAAYSGKAEVIVVLLRYGDGGVVNRKDAAGCTALKEACHFGHIEVAALLLNHGAAVENDGIDGGIWDACLSEARVRVQEIRRGIEERNGVGGMGYRVGGRVW